MFQIKRRGSIKFNDGNYGFENNRWFVEDEYNKYLVSAKEIRRKIKQQILGGNVNDDFLSNIKILGGLTHN
jgi:hypothetical protein